MEKLYNKGLVLSVLYVLLFMIAFVSGLQNPFGVVVREQFGASNAVSQIGNLANFIAYALMGYPAGKILERYGYKFSSMLAVSIGFVGVAVQYCAALVPSFWLLITGAFITGFSMCMLNTLVNPLLNIIGGGGRKGNQLLQFGGSFYTIGGMAVPYLVGLLISEQKLLVKASPVFFFAMAVFVLAFFVIKFTVIPEPDLERRREGDAGIGEKLSGSCLSFRHFVLGAVGVFLYMGVEVGIANTMNLYLTHDAGMAAGAAGAIVSIYWLFMVAGRILGGFAGSKVSSRAMLAFVSSVSAVFVLCFIFIPQDVSFSFGKFHDIPLNVVFLVLCGLCVAVMWGNIFNLAVEGLGKYTSSASGVFMIMVCGGGIVPALQGMLSDRLGYVPSFWLIVLCLLYLLFYALKGYEPAKKQISL